MAMMLMRRAVPQIHSSYGASRALLATAPRPFPAQVTTIMGGNWGDEGKGKLVDMIAGEFDITARCGGGSNAGHTVVVEGKKYAFHLMPSGILNPNNVCFLGNGVVLHVPTLFRELKSLEVANIKYDGRIKISDRAHLLFDVHQLVDGVSEESLGPEKSIGTTRRGIGPCYASKASRVGIRVGDLLHLDTFEDKFRALVAHLTRGLNVSVNVDEEVAKYREYAKAVAPFIVDGVQYINKAYRDGKRILIEGANATMLDIDFGTYPFVTSSNPSMGGACTGTGLSPEKFGCSIGIMKAYSTRVGSGPFPTELFDETGEELRRVGHEFGTTTGRPRRCGWMDIPMMKYVNDINGFDYINLTKVDVLDQLEEIKIATKYLIDGKEIPSMPSTLENLAKVTVEYITLPGWKTDISKCRTYSDLPVNTRNFVETVEKLADVNIRWIGVGPGREAMVEHIH